MKKFFTLAALLLLAFSLVSCGEKIDSSVWLTNFDDAKKAAQAENKKIFLFFSMDDSDGKSASLKENIFNTEDFIKSYTEKFVLVNLDYSNSLYESNQEEAKRNLRIFDLYNGKGTPYFMILSSEGYVITPVAFSDTIDLNDVRLSFNEAQASIQTFDELIEKTKTGSKSEKLEAINKIVEITDPSVAYHLTPLNKLYLSLDKKNETGECLKHLIALAYAKAEDFFLDDEAEKASEEFVKLTKNKILTDEDKQLAFYTAGYLLASSGSDDLEKIMSYFKQAYEINPESGAAQNIKMSMDYVQRLIDGEGDDLPPQEESQLSGDKSGLE